MSCTLYLIRHGVAEAVSANVPDSNRALTADGARRITRAAVGLKRLGIVPDAVLSSPLRRAEQTAGHLVAIVAPNLTIEILSALAPGHTPAEVLTGLRRHRNASHLILVGHEPNLSELASYLLACSPDVVAFLFKKGAVAAIEVGTVPPRSTGVLKWFVTCKQLRDIGRRSKS